MNAAQTLHDLPSTAYLLIGHGTRNAQGQNQLRQVATQFEVLMQPNISELAFLELAEPSIPVAVEKLASRGAKQIVVVPVLLFAAGHALQDIPKAVAQAAADHHMTIQGQTASLELSQAVLELSARRFRQAVCQSGQTPGCWQNCDGPRCQNIGLAMIGRGSRSAAATAKMRLFAQRRRHFTPVAALETGFIYAQEPKVDEVLQRLSQSQHSTIVIQPHLLFEGELIEQLRQQVAQYQSANTEKKWIVTGTLGTDIALAETLATLAKQI